MNCELQPPADAVLTDLEHMLQEALRAQVASQSVLSFAPSNQWDGSLPHPHPHPSFYNNGLDFQADTIPQSGRPICPRIKLSYKYEKMSVQVPQGYTKVAKNEPKISVGGISLTDPDIWGRVAHAGDMPFTHIRQVQVINLYIAWPGYPSRFVTIPLRHHPRRAGELTRGVFIFEAVAHIRMILDDFADLPQRPTGNGRNYPKLAKGNAEGLQKEDIFLRSLIPVQSGQHGVIWVPEFVVRDVVFELEQ
ncbi:hypothetical protein EVG20_g5671 [Dentipellis fragilis]|uniref:Uncharacterized protein n=1 Tax=Dentipellis fragilis TaxID=205917 RepID=A0A4Y9YSQ2_9AGAM|nr:hypothetical protein EVG20_g5671 [Dentipellis fragilis]